MSLLFHSFLQLLDLLVQALLPLANFILRLASVLTGLELDAGDLLLAGERIVNLERLFNLRHGAGREEDDLPDRFVEERVADSGPTQGMTVDIEPMVADFYQAMGWDADGVPTPAKLRELGLGAL